MVEYVDPLGTLRWAWEDAGPGRECVGWSPHSGWGMCWFLRELLARMENMQVWWKPSAEVGAWVGAPGNRREQVGLLLGH